MTVTTSLLIVAAGSASAVDPLVRLWDLLVGLGMAAAVILVNIWIGRVIWRERVVRLVAKDHPEAVRTVRKALRTTRLLRPEPVSVPADPYALTHRVVVAPLGDGRPGETFWAPGPAFPDGELGEDGSRTDARVPLAAGVHLLVVCLGRVGSTWKGHTVEPAWERVEAARAHYAAPQAALGPVDRLETAAGTGWRTTSTFGTAQVLTDTHIDHDGWAFIVGVLSRSWHARSVEAADRVLATWRWIPHDQAHWSTTPDGFPPDAWSGPGVWSGTVPGSTV